MNKENISVIRGIEPEDVKVHHIGGSVKMSLNKGQNGPNYLEMDHDELEAHVFGVEKPNRYEKTE